MLGYDAFHSQGRFKVLINAVTEQAKYAQKHLSGNATNRDLKGTASPVLNPRRVPLK
jgi:hypothetical protein